MHCSCISFVCMARHVKWEMIFINRVRTPTNRSTCVCVGRERQIGTETNHVPSLLLCATVLFLLSYLMLIMLFVIIILSIFITMKCKFAAPHGWCWMQASDKFSALAPICARCAAVLQFCNANRRNEEEMILLINISAGSNIYIYICNANDDGHFPRCTTRNARGLSLAENCNMHFFWLWQWEISDFYF